MNPELKHRHGSALKPPRAKDELVHHLESGHGSVTILAGNWTRVALAEIHRKWHIGWNSEGLEQA